MSPYYTSPLPPNEYRINGDGTATILLSQGQETVVDAHRLHTLLRYRWVAQGRPAGSYYAIAQVGGKVGRRRYHLHRMVTNAPSGMQVDHRDYDTLNNADSNLRVATATQNQANTKLRANNASGYKGIEPTHRNSQTHWMAKCQGHYLGSFPSREAAARAYDDKARELFGEFARLNFPTECEAAA